MENRITDGATSDFGRIERIVSYLRQQGTFDPGWPRNPTAKAQLDAFLIRREPGNAMDYATATVMLARASRLPARLAVGYLPGSRDPLSGAYRVTRDDAHAWAEIYFADHGWVPFDSSPRGEPAGAGHGGGRAGFIFQTGAGDAVFGAVKSVPFQFIDLLMDAVRSPVFSITVPVMFFIVLVLRWVYARTRKSVASGKTLLSYKERLSGEDRRELLRLYDELEKMLRRKARIHRESWQTVASFTGLATGGDPQVQSQISWFTRAVWRAAYDPKQLPAGLVEEGRDRLRWIRRSLTTWKRAVPRQA